MAFFDDLIEVLEEPAVDRSSIEDFFYCPAVLKGCLEPENALSIGDVEFALDGFAAWSFCAFAVETKA